MPNYANGIIYKLCCNDSTITDIYIGSTTNFTKRKQSHKYCCNNISCSIQSNCNVYQFIRKNNGWDNWSMIQIEQFNAINKRELESRERYWIETLKSTLNKIIPTRTGKEYYQENKDEIKIYKTEHKDEISEKGKEYYKENKDKIKEKVKEYREVHKDEISERGKKYREVHKDKIKAHKSKKCICECGIEYTNSHYQRHCKTKKHLDFLENKIPNTI